jgi:hypothetical protein
MIDVLKIESFIPTAYQDELEKTILGSSFPWFFNEATTDYTTDELNAGGVLLTDSTQDSAQFFHVFDETSKFNQLVTPMLHLLQQKTGLEFNSVFRIKTNLLYEQKDYPVGKHNTIHVDNMWTDKQTKSFIYYVNDSDGDTLVFKEKFGEGAKDVTLELANTPQKGTGILFDSRKYHCSSPPVKTKARAVINFVIG